MTVYLYRHVHNNPRELDDAGGLISKVDNILIEFAFKEERDERQELLTRISDSKDKANHSDIPDADDYVLKRTRLFENRNKNIVLEASEYSRAMEARLDRKHKALDDALLSLDADRYEGKVIEYIRNDIVPMLRTRDAGFRDQIKELDGCTLVFIGTNHVYLPYLLEKEHISVTDRIPEPFTPFDRAVIALCEGKTVNDKTLFAAFMLDLLATVSISSYALKKHAYEVKMAKTLNFDKRKRAAYAKVRRFFTDAQKAKDENPDWFTGEGRTLHDFLVEWVDKNICRP